MTRTIFLPNGVSLGLLFSEIWRLKYWKNLFLYLVSWQSEILNFCCLAWLAFIIVLGYSKVDLGIIRRGVVTGRVYQ